MNLYENIYDFEHLYRAYRKARRGKSWKESAVKLEVNLLEAISLLEEQLIKHTYTLSPYNVFKVYEPKERLIMSNGYKDKIVQHSLCDNVLEPVLVKRFIYDNYASQAGKGTDFALNRLCGFMQKHYRLYGANGWVLKCDISKYFYNIRHDLLKEMLRKYISCPETLWLLDMIIDSTEGNVGIPIGNQSSQLLALLYLNGLDHYIKEKLGVKFYGRYMDDFFIIHPDKDFLVKCRVEIEKIVGELGLKLNQKTQIYPLKNGIEFLGFHFYLTDTGKVIRKLRHDSKGKMRRRLKKFKIMNAEGKLPIERIECSYNSWKGHASRGNCYHLIKQMDDYYHSLYKEDTKMSTAKERLDTEISDLAEKIKKASWFIKESDTYKKLAYAEQYLLRRQVVVMQEYLEILTARKSLFKEVE